MKKLKKDKERKNSWGYVGEISKEKLEEEKQKLITQRALSKKYSKEILGNEILKRQLAKQDKKFKAKYAEFKPSRQPQSFSQQMSQIQRQVVQQQRPQPQQRIVQQQQVQPIQQPQEERWNFFDGNRSFTEVYGDEELTFFDSNKGDRVGRRTGSLFGI